MYTLYIPKYKGEKRPYLVQKVVNTISQYCLNKNSPFGIFMAPGYLSKTENTIQEFTKDFPFSSMNNSIKNSYLGIFKGMNSWAKVTLSNSKKDTVLNVHSREYTSVGNNWVDLTCKAHKEDHRKMLFVFSLYDPNTTIPSQISKSNINSFLKLVDVNFVLIGSSNQSHNTYFAPCCTKGEADILLFTEQRFLDVLYAHAQTNDIPINADSKGNTPLRSCILSSTNEIRSSGGKTFKTPQNNFLKDILKEYMENTLI